MDFFNNIRTKRLIYTVLALLIAFLAVKTVYELQLIGNSNYDKQATNTITVSGKGEAVAIPDIATFSFSVTKEAETADAAQQLATDAANKILAVIKTAGVDDKDVKTSNYNLSPQYDYNQVVCVAYPCPSRQTLRGYQVTQTFEVKIRDIAKAGSLVVNVTKAGATDIYGPNFSVDKEDSVIAEARDQAIVNAKAKADAIAKGLNVRLVRIVSFTEDEGGSYYPQTAVSSFGAMKDSAATPAIPVGQSKYARTVYITYEIR